MVVAGLGESEVPLEEDILKKPIDFVKSWVEFAADGGGFTQVIENFRGALAGTSTFFTVPQKQTLFITSAFVSLYSTAGAQDHGDGSIRIAGTGKIILNCSVDHHTTASPSVGMNSLSFPMPLKFEAGEIIQASVQDIAGGVFNCGFTGFLVSKRIS